MNAPNVTLVRVIETGHDWLYSVAWSPDGTMLATCGRDFLLKVWDAQTGQNLVTLDAKPGFYEKLAFAPGGAILAAASHTRGVVRLLDTRDWHTLKLLRGHSGPVTALSFSQDGELLASGGDDGTVRRWDARSGVLVARQDAHAGGVYSVTFAPDGGSLVKAGADGTVKAWPARAAQQAGAGGGVPLFRREQPIVTLRVAPGGRWLAAGADDGAIVMFDLSASRIAWCSHAHAGTVTGLAFTPDGELLVTGGWDGVAYVCDPVAGTAVGPPIPLPDGCTGLQFAPAGRRLAVATADGRVALVDLTGA